MPQKKNKDRELMLHLEIFSSLMKSLPDMEDEHAYRLCLNEEKESHIFAVFDGHGGHLASQFASKKICDSVISHSAYRKYNILGS